MAVVNTLMGLSPNRPQAISAAYEHSAKWAAWRIVGDMSVLAARVSVAPQPQPTPSNMCLIDDVGGVAGLTVP